MARHNRPSTGRVLFHFIFGLLTGGLWWLWLLVRAVLTINK